MGLEKRREQTALSRWVYRTVPSFKASDEKGQSQGASESERMTLRKEFFLHIV